MQETIIYALSLGFVPKMLKHNMKRIEEWDDIIKKENRICLALSSGIDSHYVLHKIRNKFPDKKITCVGLEFPYSHSEKIQAEEKARYYNCDYKVKTIDNPFKDLGKICKILKEPNWRVYQYYLIEFAKKYSNLLVTGDAGDSLFGGHTDRYAHAIKVASKLAVDSKTANLPDIAQRIEIFKKGMLHDSWIEDNNEMFTFGTSQIEKTLNGYFYNFLPTASPMLDSMMWCDIHARTLFDVIPNTQKLCDKFKIKYVPYMWNHEYFYYASILPWYEKYDYMNNIGKIPLRKELGRLEERTPKINFGIDYKMAWVKGLRKLVQEGIEEKSDVIFKVINEKWYRDKIKCTTPIYWNKLINIYCLSLLAKG